MIIKNKGLDAIPEYQKTAIRKKWFDSASKGSLYLTDEEHLYLKNHPTIRFISDPVFAPIEFFENGTYKGVSADLLQEIEKLLGVKTEIIQTDSWDETLERFNKCEADILTANIPTKELSQKYIFSDEIFSFPDVIIGIKNKHSKFLTLNDLKNEDILVVKNWPEESYLRNNYPDINIVTVKDIIEGLCKIAKMEYDYFFGYMPTSQYYIDKKGYYGLGVVGMSENVLSDAMMFHKEDTILQSIINKALKTVPIEKKRTIFNKWIKIDYSEKRESKVMFTDKQKGYLKQKGSIKMCIDPNWMPFEAIDKNGKHIGIAADILSIVEKKTDIKFDLVPSDSWVDSMDLAQKRKCDIFSLAMQTPSREKYMDFTTPYVSFPFVVATKNSEIFIDNINAKENSRNRVSFLDT